MRLQNQDRKRVTFLTNHDDYSTTATKVYCMSASFDQGEHGNVHRRGCGFVLVHQTSGALVPGSNLASITKILQHISNNVNKTQGREGNLPLRQPTP